MENKEDKDNFTFNVLNSVGWTMVIMRLANIISTPWSNIGSYWLVLLGICLATAIIDPLVNKVGGHSAK